MRRLAILTAVLLVPARAMAQGATDVTPAPAAPPAPAETSELLTPTSPEWKLRYEEARAKLLTGEFVDAAIRFAELERTAQNRVDSAVAREQASLATEWAKRGLVLVQRSDVHEASNASARALDKRTTDEIVSLYTTAVIYGLGSGGWVAGFTKPSTFAGGALPALALAGGSVGIVAAMDAGRGLRYGVPQSVVSGLYVGLEHGIVWSIWATRRPGSSWTTEGAATLVWGLTTAGAIGGGVLGSVIATTPGRASWVGSSALWSGVVVGFFAGAALNDSYSPFAASGLGLSVGTGVGLATAAAVSPTIARVRLIDLGGVGGGLLTALLYFSAANDKIDGRVAAALTAVGAMGGLATAYALTSGMTEDRPRAPTADAASARLPPRRLSALERLQPLLMPANGGALFGAGGSLD